MIPSFKQLAGRTRGDVAALALFGGIPSNFGAEAPVSAGVEVSPYAQRHDFGAEYGAEYGAEFGAEYGAEFGADPMHALAGLPGAAPAVAHAPSHAQLHAAHRHMVRKHHGTQKRLSLLNPNKDSDVDIEAYVFSLNPSQFAAGAGLLWGTANGWTAFKNPQVAFRAERMFVNVKIPGLIYINTVQAANVNAQIGGVADGFTFSVYAMGSKISLPTLPPQNTMQVTGTWSTVVDTPYITGQAFAACIDFEGWATVTPK